LTGDKYQILQLGRVYSDPGEIKSDIDERVIGNNHERKDSLSPMKAISLRAKKTTKNKLPLRHQHEYK
jgi:hypothetical protein